MLSQSFAGTMGSTTAVAVKLPDTSLFSSVESGQPAIETTSQLSDRGRFEQVFANSLVSSVASYVAIVPFVERRMVAAGVAEGADEASSGRLDKYWFATHEINFARCRSPSFIRHRMFEHRSNVSSLITTVSIPKSQRFRPWTDTVRGQLRLVARH